MSEAVRIKLRQAVIVEGKYDKIKLESLLDAVIIPTGGFGIYKDKVMLSLIRAFAEKEGVVILTDSDHAGFQIRNHLKNVIKKGKVWHVYIPDIYGRERRKDKPSKEGKLGVEGVSAEVLKSAFERAGIPQEGVSGANDNEYKAHVEKIRGRLYEDNFIGCTGAAARKKELLKALSLPENLSTNALVDVLAVLYTEDEYKKAAESVFYLTEKF